MMKRKAGSIRSLGGCLSSAILLVAMAVSLSGQTAGKPKKFLTGPLVIEDQGSFFIGGVPKVTD